MIEDEVSPESIRVLQRSAGNAAVARLVGEERPVSLVDAVKNRNGRPLEHSVRERMEQALGHGFGDVRIHTDKEANDSAKAIGAEAYTTGTDVVFSAGAYAPLTSEGKRLLAHELTHVIQQRSGSAKSAGGFNGFALSDPRDSSEQAAEATADLIVRSDHLRDSRDRPPLETSAEANADSATMSEGATLSDHSLASASRTIQRQVTEGRDVPSDADPEIDGAFAAQESVAQALYSIYSNSQLVARASQLDAEVMGGYRNGERTQRLGPRERAQKACSLFLIYDIIEQRITRAPIDETGLPRLDGLSWNGSSPLAGQLMDIMPFGNMDLWASIAECDRPQRRRRTRRLRETVLDPIDITGTVPRRPRPQFPEPIRRHRPRPPRIEKPPGLPSTLWMAIKNLWKIIKNPGGNIPFLEGLRRTLQMYGQGMETAERIARYSGERRGYADTLAAMAAETDSEEGPQPMVPILSPPTDLIDYFGTHEGYRAGTWRVFDMVRDMDNVHQPGRWPSRQMLWELRQRCGSEQRLISECVLETMPDPDWH